MYGIAFENFGLATNDSTVVAEGYKSVNTHLSNVGNEEPTQVLIVWQQPAEGWGSEPSVPQSFVLEAGHTLEEHWNSVALDAQTIAVGARSDNSNQGAVYVWDNPPDTYYAKAKLLASDRRPGDQLGWTLSISGNTVTAGACPSDGRPRSAVYIFVEPPSGWVSVSRKPRSCSIPAMRI